MANKGEAYKFGLDDSAAGVSAFLRAASADAKKEGSGSSQQSGELRLSQYMGPRDMIATQLPHIKWSDKVCVLFVCLHSQCFCSLSFIST